MNDFELHYSEILQKAKKCSHEVAENFIPMYMRAPFAEELSKVKEVFLENQDFKVGLFALLFYQLKVVGIWNDISDKDWDDLCDLTMLNSWEILKNSKK